MIKRICDLSLFVYFPLLLLINVDLNVGGCQPPIQYHSSAAYGSPQFQPDPQQAESPFIQSSLQEELVQNQVNPDETQIANPTLPQPTVNNPVNDAVSSVVTRPPNPFVPIESQPAEKSAQECASKTITSFMDILDCTHVETYNTDGSTARYGSNECGFEPQSLCRFYSEPDEELQFRRGIFAHHNLQENSTQLQFSQFEDSFSSLTKRPLGAVPSKNFLVIAEPFGNTMLDKNTPKVSAILQTDIRCAVGNGELSFDYWSTVDDVVLKVCTRVGQDRRCTANIAYSVDSTNVQVQVVHPEGDSFVVEIIVTEFNHPGIFIIDNLKYQADLCEITTELPSIGDSHLIARPSNSNPKAFSQPTFDIDGPFLSINGKSMDNVAEIKTPPSTEIEADSSTEKPIRNVNAVLVDNETSGRWLNSLKIQRMRESACDILDCNFNHDLCRYFEPELQEENVMLGRWQTANLRLDGAKQSSNNTNEREGFAFVGMDDRSIKTKGRKVYVLESQEFQLKKDAVLSFDLYRRSNAISLQVCVDTLSNCLYEAPPVRSASYWRINETVSLPKESRKIFFVAEQIKRFKWLAMDNLKLLSDECLSV